MTADPARIARNEALLRERVHEDVRAGRAFVHERIGELFTGVLGRALTPLVRAFYAAVGEAAVERRIHRYLDLVLEAAADARARGLDAAVDAWAPRALALEELVHRGDPTHPAFPRAEALLREAFRERLDFLGAFVERGRGDSYEEAVRMAFPERGAVEAVLDRQFRLARESIDLVEENPRVLRFPLAFRGPLYRLARDAVGWYEERVRRDLARIYG